MKAICPYCKIQSDMELDKPMPCPGCGKIIQVSNGLSKSANSFGFGLFIIIIGIILSVTGIGAIIGVPMIVVGLYNIVKSAFSK